MNDEPQPRPFRVSLAHLVIAEIEITSTTPAAARELALQQVGQARRRLTAAPYAFRTETIERMVDGKPLWVEVP
jgi:hypothetical protein